jgi:hypothetical protein
MALALSNYRIPAISASSGIEALIHLKVRRDLAD